MEIITEKAYAKINLALDVFPKRADGYHDLETVMQSVSLCDSITLKRSDSISLDCNDKNLSCGEDNLAYKAAKLFFSYTGIKGGVEMYLNKNIPSPAGLGGGSSDAAAVFRGLNKLYKAKLTFEEMRMAVIQLGSDVPFCIEGGTAFCEGRGEIITPLKSFEGVYYVVSIKGEGIPTPEVFKLFDKSEKKPVYTASRLAESINGGKFCETLKSFSNTLESVSAAIRPQINELKTRFIELGAVVSQMSGSGPSVFGVFLAERAAESAARSLEKENVRAYVCVPESPEKLA